LFTVLEDYLHLLLPLADFAPDIFYLSSAFPSAFRVLLASLTMIHTDVVYAGLDLLRIILTHDCLHPSVPNPPNFPLYANSINAAIENMGFDLVGYLLSGIVGEFEEAVMSAVVSIFRSIATLWPSQLVSWLGPVLQQLPEAAVSNQSKEQFMVDVSR
jgi:transportin-3